MDSGLHMDSVVAGGGVDPSPERIARSYLSAVVLGPSRAVADFVADEGPVAAADAIRRGSAPSAVLRRTQARVGFADAARDLEKIAVLGGRLCTPEDDDWPSWPLLPLDAVDSENPDHAPPLALWTRGGSSLGGLVERSVAVVGTRASSSYGETITTEVTDGLLDEGWTVTSGGAYGIDAVAHRTAVSGDRPTVAVLACGIDRPYPAGHSRLFEAIAAGPGAIVSEYPPGIRPARHRFLARNRLLAALSAGVVVTEAGRRSGARNTVAWARRIGRPTMACPGPITSAASVGCHHMIRSGEVILVIGAGDILSELTVGATTGDHDDSRPEDALPRRVLQVYDAFNGYRRHDEQNLVFLSGLPPDDVRRALVRLELEHLVARDDDGWYRMASNS